MLIKCKYQDIKDIYDWCEKYADDEAKELIGTQPSTHLMAYYTPSQANWAYHIGIVHYKNSFYEVVLVFGEVRAVRLCQVPHYIQANKMARYRYVITGGDNGYCARCGGLCDRSLLRIDDKNKTYKQYYFFGGCLGKWCWLEQKFSDGLTLVRGKKWQGDFTKMWGGNIYKMWRIENGEVVEEYPVVVKGGKYGKDGEFGDKLDHYKYEGFIEPQERIDEARERAREVTKKLYERIAKGEN